MPAQITLDLEQLRTAAARSRTLGDDFANARDDAERTADAVGDADLGDRVREFGDAWDTAREDLRDGMRSLADHLQAIVDTFTDLDLSMSADGDS